MAGRGHGRGWGRGFGSYAAEVPYVLFPEDVVLPDAKFNDIDLNMKRLLNWNNKFQNYWKASPYLLEETTVKGQRADIERFSDKKKTEFARDSLSQVLVFKDFPKELTEGTSRRIPRHKRFRWNPESGIKRFDFFEQREEKDKDKEDKGEKENKDGEDEDEDEDEEDEESEEDFGDDDYMQNEYFDDDEDDYNDVDDGDDEPTY